MKKRPLCLAALLTAFLLLCLPAELFWKSSCLSEGRGAPDFISGEVCGLDPDGRTVRLKHTNVSDTGILLVYFKAEQEISIGNLLRIEENFTLKEPEAPTNPGQFDGRAYNQTQDIVLICYADRAVVTDAKERYPAQWLYLAGQKLQRRLEQVFPEQDAEVLKAMLLGERSGLPAEVKSVYQRSGMSHLLAISGLHVSFLGMGLYRLLRRLGGSWVSAGFPAGTAILFYGLLTGMSTSTARAVIMLLVALGADILGRSYDLLTALAMGALLLLVDQPLLVRDPSFLLSFGAVLGIGLVFPVLRGYFPPAGKRLQALGAGVAIQLVTLPLVAYFYYEVPVYGIFLNLLVVPLMSLVMVSGLSALGLTFLSVKLAGIPAWLCSLLLRSFSLLGSLSLKLPGAVWVCGKPKKWQMALYYGGLVLWLWKYYQNPEKEKERAQEKERTQKKGSKLRQCRKLLPILILMLLLFWRTDRGFSFTMLDVGQGDGLFLRTGQGTTLLIDGGSTDVKQVGTYRILPFLKAKGVGTLDYMLVTHTDEDHISGLREILEEAGKPGGVRVRQLLLTGQARKREQGRKLEELAEKAGTAVREVQEGSLIRERDTLLSCLHPEKKGEYEDVNGESEVWLVEYKEFRLLLTGDLGEQQEQEIWEREKKRGESLSCQVLKAGHHGSRYSSSEEWLQQVKPELTLISCGADNRYGHPHGETLERLAAVGSEILVTAKNGAVTIQSDGRRFTAEAFGCISR